MFFGTVWIRKTGKNLGTQLQEKKVKYVKPVVVEWLWHVNG